MLAQTLRRASCGLSIAFAPVLMVTPACAQQSNEKPPLSAEIRAVFERDGAAAAEERYEEVVASDLSEFAFDLNGMMKIGEKYSLAGDYESAQVFMMIAGRMSRRAIMQSPLPAQIGSMGDSGARADTAEMAAARPAAMPASDRGPARADLAQFRGVYGDPASQEFPRNFLVVEDCSGHLQFGAMWGDVAPWTMTSVGDAQFVHAAVVPGGEPIELGFHRSQAGRPEALTHTFTFGKGPARIQRLDDLPAGWEPDCSEPVSGGR